MTISELSFSTLRIQERETLREALEHRRRSLDAALRLYLQTEIETAPRLALVRRTRSAIAEIDRAFDRMSESRYGVCNRCDQPITVATLILQPLASFCRHCDGPEAA